ncbi:hypothetical protein HanIR_Chr17g0885241 [Helianthus annuus]|nr:hypothetical protein HanIR_Chr17g0885241 [Helianthus annuus]KAJ0448453.1 hypothetical protein HanHA89_Chr17g0717031 [Helianthus annuus]KAJ0633340.1 hypothetical protein HanLR1_Chr17g0675561 [Helianthus annuus]
MAHTLFGQFLDTPLASHTLPLCQTRISILHYSYYTLRHCHSLLLLLHNYFHGYSHCCLYHKILTILQKPCVTHSLSLHHVPIVIVVAIVFLFRLCVSVSIVATILVCEGHVIVVVVVVFSLVTIVLIHRA